MSGAKILLIEDDELLGSTLAENLQLEHYEVDWVKDGQAGSIAAEKKLHDLIVLDLMLPHKNGFEILESLRKLSDTPVLIISARGGSFDKIRGLKLKADDYLTKPFHLEEFLLRISNLLRRSRSSEIGQSLQKNESYQVGLCKCNLRSYELQSQSGESISLSEKEGHLLRLLISRANQYVSRQEIIDSVWGHSEFSSPRTIDNMILKLRKHIEPEPSKPQFILSMRGLGYCLKLGEKNEN